MPANEKAAVAAVWAVIASTIYGQLSPTPQMHCHCLFEYSPAQLQSYFAPKIVRTMFRPQRTTSITVHHLTMNNLEG